MRSQMKRKAGKASKQYNDDWGDSEDRPVRKTEYKKRRFKQTLRKAIDNGDYDELEDFYRD